MINLKKNCLLTEAVFYVFFTLSFNHPIIKSDILKKHQSRYFSILNRLLIYQ